MSVDHMPRDVTGDRRPRPDVFRESWEREP